jgi:ribonuclease T1
VARIRRPLLALIVLVVALGIGYGVNAARGSHTVAPPAVPSTAVPTARSTAGSSAGPTLPSGTVALSSLPPQAATTVHLIQSGGPFPYREDGEIFDNNEHRLPAEPNGYYHSYTVVTPGSPDRGERRIITGRGGQYWYTADHYVTFRRLDVNR